MESKLKNKLEKREFPITVEFFAPRGVNVNGILTKAKKLSSFITAFNITDNHRATMRISSMALSVLLNNHSFEPILQLTCRDRNLLALQSELLGAYALGIRNVFFISGDSILVGDYPDATGVYDVDSIGFLKIAKTLEDGKDVAGKKLNGSPVFFKGAALNLTPDDFNKELDKLNKKINAGVDFFQTQLIFSVDTAIKMKSYTHNIPVLAGVTILKNLKFANFLNKKVPGVYIPKDIIKFIEKSGNELKAGIDIAVDIIKNIHTYFEGLHIMALGLEEYIPEIIKRAGLI